MCPWEIFRLVAEDRRIADGGLFSAGGRRRCGAADLSVRRLPLWDRGTRVAVRNDDGRD
jgi:hypothetical protein